jgi:uncharacterized membrane protein
MANPPPPYDDITGISRTVMKDNAQETVTNYNGYARHGEMTVDLTNNTVYIGNVNGNLTKVIQSTGNAVALGNVRSVNDTTGLYQLYFDPATGEVVYYQP